MVAAAPGGRRRPARCPAARGGRENMRVATNRGGEGLVEGLTGEGRSVVPPSDFR
jgi:hypothetical protein